HLLPLSSYPRSPPRSTLFPYTTLFRSTHDHVDHSEAVPAMRGRFAHAPVAAARGEVDELLSDGSTFGPFEAVATPGHAPDHLAYIVGDVALTGDAVLGEGSVFIAPDPGALASYLDGLAKLRRRELTVI